MKPLKLSAAGFVIASTLLAAGPAMSDIGGKVKGPEVSEFTAKQGPGQLRAAKWVGVSVKNKAGDTVGDINDVIIGPGMTVTDVVIGVGGFLGIAEKNVAVSAKEVTMSVDKNNNRVAILNVTKDALSKAPGYKFANDKTLRERLDEIGKAASEGYESVKDSTKEGYKKAKDAVIDATTEDTDQKSKN